MIDAFLSSIHTKSNYTSANQASKCEDIQQAVSDFIGKTVSHSLTACKELTPPFALVTKLHQLMTWT